MDQNSQHNAPNDPLDDLLRRYLLENDPETTEGESLMELAGEKALASAPAVTPDPIGEEALIAKLEHNFPAPAPEPELPPATSYLRKGLIGFGALAVLTILMMFGVDLLVEGPNGFTEALRKFGSPEASTLADTYGPQPPQETLLVFDDTTSLLAADENPYLIPEDEIPTGEKERGGRRPSLRKKATPPVVNVQPNRMGGSFPLTSTLSPSIPSVISPNPVSLEKPAPDPFPLAGLYAQTKAPAQYFQIDPKQDHLLDTRNGTVVHIPREAFIGQAGEAVRSTVQIEVREVYDKAGMVRSNLPTISNGRQLISGGVVYLDATAAGRRLKLAQGKQIYLEFAKKKGVDTRDMQLYAGEYNEKGLMNWVPMGGKVDKMIPLPLDEMYFDEFICDCKDERVWNFQLLALTDKHYANTWIATREFRQRVHALREVGYYLPGLNYYRKHTDEPLWKVDQKVAEMLREDAARGIGKTTDAQYFEKFAQEFHSDVVAYDDRGVDLGRWDARRQLLYRRVSRQETDDLMRLYKLRRAHVEAIESRLILQEVDGHKIVLNVRRDKKEEPGEHHIKGFLTSEMGWINLDKVAAPTFARNDLREIKVRLAGNTPLDANKNPFEPITTFLVYKNLNTVVQGSPITGQFATFQNIPRNAEAYVVAIGYDKYVPYIGITRLNRGATVVRVEMAATTVDAYMTELNRLNS